MNDELYPTGKSLHLLTDKFVLRHRYDLPDKNGNHVVVASVRFNPEDGMSRAQFQLPDDGIDYSYADRLSTALDSLSSRLSYHAALCRLALNSPDQHGLTARTLDASHVGPRPTPLQEMATGENWSNKNEAHPVINLFPTALTGDNTVWAAPDADLTRFGTYYLLSLGHIDNRSGYREGDGDQTIRWALAQVGVSETLDAAAWNDAVNIAALASRALNDDTETGLVMAALADTGKVTQGLREHQWRRAILDARTAFPGKTLRPRLVPDLVSALLREQRLETRGGYRRQTEAATHLVTGLCELNNYEIFGWNREVKPIAAAYAGQLEDATDIQFRTFVTALQEKLTERKLGTVLITSDMQHAFWITLDVALFNTYRAAFWVPESAVLYRVSDWLAGRTDTPITALTRTDVGLTA